MNTCVVSTAGLSRKHAAVMFADVVGYARLMEQDEDGTHAALSRLRARTLEPLVQRYRGRIVHVAGDGLLVIFASASDALECAVGIQRATLEFGATNLGIGPIRFRIGINFAEILIDEVEVAGTGVNIAARLEALADAGGISVSQAFVDQVGERVGVEFIDDGLRWVKNISRPVHVFHVAPARSARVQVKRRRSGDSGDNSWWKTMGLGAPVASRV